MRRTGTFNALAHQKMQRKREKVQRQRMYKGTVESETAVETESIHARVIIPCNNQIVRCP